MARGTWTALPTPLLTAAFLHRVLASFPKELLLCVSVFSGQGERQLRAGGK